MGTRTGWKAATIRSVLAGEFPGEWGLEPIAFHGNAKVLRSTNLDDEGHVDYGSGAERQIPLSKLVAKRLRSGDILLEASGGGPNKPVGRVAIFAAPDGRDYVCSNFFRTLRPSPNVDPRFLLWRLLAVYKEPRIWSFQQQTTGIINLKVSEYLAQMVEWPPLPEQRRIVAILDALDATIARTEALIAKLKQARAGLLHDLLTCGLDERGELRDPIAHPEQFKETAVGRVPREWDVINLERVAEISSGVTLGRDLQEGTSTIEVPYLRVANVQDGYLDLSEMKIIRIYKSELPRYLLQNGDVLMNEGGDYDKLGRGAVWNGDIEPCLHQNHVFKVRTNRSQLLPEFLALLSASTKGKQYFILSSKQSTNLASINSTQLKAFPVLLPSLLEQTRVLAAIETYDARLRAEESYRDKLKLQKQGLMHDLLTGRVRL